MIWLAIVALIAVCIWAEYHLEKKCGRCPTCGRPRY